MTPHPAAKLWLMQPVLGAVPSGALPPAGFVQGAHRGTHGGAQGGSQAWGACTPLP